MKNAAFLYLAAVALALAAGCASVEHSEHGSYSGHSAFIERARVGW